MQTSRRAVFLSLVRQAEQHAAFVVFSRQLLLYEHKKELSNEFFFEKNTPEGSRTPNLLIRSQMLYPIELRVLFKLVCCDGAGCRTRTDDLMITNQLLYQLS